MVVIDLIYVMFKSLQIIPSLGAGQYLGAATCSNRLIFLNFASDMFAEINLVNVSLNIITAHPS